MFWMFRCIKYMIFGGLAIVLMGWITMLLWNWLLPDLVNVPVISIFQAIGLVVLSRILFGGFGGNHYKHKHCEGKSMKDKMKEKWRTKFEGMSEEEKEAYKERMQQCWGHKWKNKDHDD